MVLSYIHVETERTLRVLKRSSATVNVQSELVEMFLSLSKKPNYTDLSLILKDRR